MEPLPYLFRHPQTGLMSGPVIVQAQVNRLGRFHPLEHGQHRNGRRPAARHIAVVFPLLWVEGEV